MPTPSEPRDRAGAVEWLPILFSILLAATMAVFGAFAPEPADFGDLGRFGRAFAGAVRQSRVFLFPLAVATSIFTMIALLRHGRALSGRGRLQVLAVVSLFISAFASTAYSEPITDAIAAAVRAGKAIEVEGLYARWSALQRLSFIFAVVAMGSLMVAQRLAVPPAPTAILTPRHRSLLFLLGAATLFEGYDRFIASLALPYIGRDLEASEGDLGFALSAIRAGALASIVFGRVADRHGRRRLLLFTILAYTLATAATGLSRGIESFVVFQLVATIFLTTELAVAQVVITEEFPATFRAMGQGFLGAFSALGAGFAAMLFPMLQETELGWRGLYFLGILPLLLIAYMRRSLPETERWQRARAEGLTERYRFGDLLAPGLRLRFLVLIAASIAAYVAASSAFAFASYRATRDFGWSPAQVSTMIVLGGGLGMGGWFLFGALAERLGRRPVGVTALAGCGAAVLIYYRTEWLMLAFGLLVAMEAGVSVALNALGTELFPTRMRSTAKTWIINATIVGGLIGLAIVGALSELLGGANRVVSVLALVPIVVSPLLFLLPEPRGRELEEMVDEAVLPAASETR